MKTDKAEIIREIERQIENRDGYYPLQIEAETDDYFYNVVLTVSQKFGREQGGDVGEELGTVENRNIEIHSIMRTDEFGHMEADTPRLQQMAEDIEHYFEI